MIFLLIMMLKIIILFQQYKKNKVSKSNIEDILSKLYNNNFINELKEDRLEKKNNKRY